MSRKVRQFVEIKDYASLDELISRLVEIRDSLPEEAEPQVKMKGDDIFGRLLCVSFLRPQTVEEAECDARYAEAYRASREQELSRLQSELGVVCSAPGARPRRLRAVA
jgi:hypothetical protein